MNRAHAGPNFLKGGTMVVLMGAALAAQAQRTDLTVTATVLKHASMQVVAQPDAVVVTSEDIARGFVDVPGTAQFVVQSNTRDGYLLNFVSQGDFFRQTVVLGLIANQVQLGAGGGVVAQAPAGSGMTRMALDLGFRFVLSQSARQGVYSWPLRLSVAPL